MQSLVKLCLVVLLYFVACTGCASVQTDCTTCVLLCNGVPDLRQHQDVIISISGNPEDKLYDVNSLYVDGRFGVPGCFQSCSDYSVKIYENNNAVVSHPLFEETGIQPVCSDTESDRRVSSGANRNTLRKLLVLPIVCVYLFQK